ncbi:alternate-type signal peptide domain-containing protein [Pseudarthrobacter sp. NIBRBAC000502770]|uniref:alternate-type signal peptide domain-containing protein n=1 Tax=Pseudarthrobacter sp. NIBRBAC000502770 TaxID=2590785 RepID=UPI00113FD6C3|nr:alternate-type signal peptide domain-containing protein [Pseudarthrobacter sp. NIBRBAC000502770]QDG89350.1 alternate-type signal peptide domain-containing protein [Pseudarthrobacter sp. NIBRBAC000502770]
MKNSTLVKGTAAIAVGAALLLGGGGTLAAWNAVDTATPGTIAAGDLNVKAGTGVWKDRNNNPIDINTYKIVPGDKLTYSQDLTVTLVGDKMAANVVLANVPASTFTSDNVTVSPLKLSNGAGDVTSTTVLKPVTGSATQTVTATTVFEFKGATTGRSDVTKEYNLGNVSYTLSQVLPAGA